MKNLKALLAAYRITLGPTATDKICASFIAARAAMRDINDEDDARVATILGAVIADMKAEDARTAKKADKGTA